MLIRTDEVALARAMVRVARDAIICLNPEGVIAEWNPVAESMFGWPAAEAIGRSIQLILPADRYAEETRFRARVLAGGTFAVDTVRLHRDGTPIPVAVTMAPLIADGLEAVGVLLIVQSARSRELSEPDSRRLAAIVESSDDAIVSKDLNGIVTSWNNAAERMFGYAPTEMIGNSIRLLIPEDRQSEEDETLAKIQRGEKLEHFETVRRRKDGSLIPISLTVSPIRTGDGRIIGASKIARDVSLMKRTEAERFRLIKENAAVTETLNEVGSLVASGLDRATIIQAVTDSATELTTAAFGAFFYNLVDEKGESYSLFTISGAPREAFSRFPMPRNTDVFATTFKAGRVVRSDDITRDPRYGRNAPHEGMPAGHLPVHSYLAVPVKTSSGDVLGGLLFGHPDAGRFSEHHERLAVGIASWAAVALENARLYATVQEANRLKDEFLASLSHELRTPLNAILGYARMLQSGIVSADRRHRAVETIERNAISLRQIVEDVLDVSRIVSGKMRLNFEAVDFAELVRSAIDAVSPAADAKGVRLELAIGSAEAAVSGDAGRLQQILWNLFSNAVKFTNRGGRVQVRLERVDSRLEVIVSDTGIGIAKEFLPHIFERFRQADSGINRERGGLGLGLAITRQLTEMHGGTIDVSSEGLGRGTTFRLTLPLILAQTAGRAQGEMPAEPAETAEKTPLPDLQGIRVLAVDDDRDALLMTSEVLESAGARVAMAASATDALALLDRAPYDVIVADVGMPQMDGFDFIARVRQHADPLVRLIPAAALTAYAQPDDRIRTLRAGFQIHLSKPADPVELMLTVASLARRFEGGNEGGTR